MKKKQIEETVNKEITETKTESTDGTATATPAAVVATPAAAAATNTNTQTYFEETEVADLNEQQRYNLKHREVFYSKYTDTIAATSIRAKCSVLLFCEEIEKYSDYLIRDVNIRTKLKLFLNTFFDGKNQFFRSFELKKG